MKTRHYLITVGVAYILFLLIYTPASAVISAFRDSVPQIKIEGVTGTIWNGRAQRITYSHHVLENTHWSTCSWRLITGEACVELEAKYNDNNFHSEIGVNVTGTVKARDLQANLDAEALGEQLRLPLGKLSGDVLLNIEQLVWAGGYVPTAEGVIKWNNAAITLAEQTDLGMVSIQITESDEYPLTATLNNNGGHIAINGHINIGDDGTYSLELKLLPGNSASVNLRKNLGTFTKKQSDGSYLVENNGNLNELGIM